jgi:hypothetical protein
MPDYEEVRELTTNEKELFLRGYGYEIINGFMINILNDPKYLKQKRLSEIEAELKNQDLIFAQKGEVIKEYNGKPYKIRYANDYQTLVIPSFMDDIKTKDIWDATELEFTPMTKAEVQDLYEFLKPDYESAFQDRKTNRAKLLKEKIELQNGGMGND